MKRKTERSFVNVSKREAIFIVIAISSSRFLLLLLLFRAPNSNLFQVVGLFIDSPANRRNERTDSSEVKCGTLSSLDGCDLSFIFCVILEAGMQRRTFRKSESEYRTDGMETDSFTLSEAETVFPWSGNSECG